MKWNSPRLTLSALLALCLAAAHAHAGAIVEDAAVAAGLHGQEVEAVPAPAAPAVTVELVARPQTGAETTSDLRLVTRGDTAKVTSLKVAGALLGAFAGGRHHTTGFSKEQLKGKRLEALPDPTGALMLPMLEQRIGALLQSRSGHSAAPAALRIMATPGDWTLIYQHLKRSDTPYELRYQASISAEEAGVDGPGPARWMPTVQCRPEPQAMPLGLWQEDAYAQVHGVAADYVRQCADLVEAQVGEWLAMLDAPPPSEADAGVDVDVDASGTAEDAAAVVQVVAIDPSLPGLRDQHAPATTDIDQNAEQ